MTNMKRQTGNLVKFKIYLAALLLFLTVAAIDPWVTGIAFHEWISVLVILPLFIIHIQVDWKWIVSVSRRFFRRQPGRKRFNYVWDWLLFGMLTAVAVSGVLVSESFLPFFGISNSPDAFWVKLHSDSSSLLVLLLGVHLANHWRWVVRTTGKLSTSANTSADRKAVGENADRLSLYGRFFAQCFIIVLVGLVIAVPVFLLGNTEWADAVRFGASERIQMNRTQEQPGLAVRFGLSMIFTGGKIIFSALITFAVLAVLRFMKK